MNTTASAYQRTLSGANATSSTLPCASNLPLPSRQHVFTSRSRARSLAVQSAKSSPPHMSAVGQPQQQLVVRLALSGPDMAHPHLQLAAGRRSSRGKIRLPLSVCRCIKTTFELARTRPFCVSTGPSPLAAVAQQEQALELTEENVELVLDEVAPCCDSTVSSYVQQPEFCFYVS